MRNFTEKNAWDNILAGGNAWAKWTENAWVSREIRETWHVWLGIMIGPTNWNNWSTFGGDPVFDTDIRSLFHFPRHCGIRDFRRFTSISHTVTGRFLRQSRNDWRRQANESITFWERSGMTSGWWIRSRFIRKSWFQSRITFGWDFGLGRGLRAMNKV